MKNRVTRSLLTTLRKSKSLNQADSEFLSIYYHRLSGQDYEPAKAKEFLQIARHHRKLGEKRSPGECIVELSNHAVPGVTKSGIGNYTHIFIVQQDRAFIIDSLQIKLSNLGKTPYRTFHPLFAVTRNASHKAVRYGKASDYTEGRWI